MIRRILAAATVILVAAVLLIGVAEGVAGKNKTHA